MNLSPHAYIKNMGYLLNGTQEHALQLFLVNKSCPVITLIVTKDIIFLYDLLCPIMSNL